MQLFKQLNSPSASLQLLNMFLFTVQTNFSSLLLYVFIPAMPSPGQPDESGATIRNLLQSQADDHSLVCHKVPLLSLPHARCTKTAASSVAPMLYVKPQASGSHRPTSSTSDVL